MQKEEQMLMYMELSEAQSNLGSVRRPVQCEGAERGHRRTSEVASYGAVNPQQFGSKLGLLSNILPISGLF
jgi:hypothetical protein